MKLSKKKKIRVVRLSGKIYNAGDGKEINKEPVLKELHLEISKFNNRTKPTDLRNIALFPSFSEFGSEVVSVLYCIPYYLRNVYPGYYAIAAGWYGRGFLYQHLVDEFWHLPQDVNWLRDYCRAFHHVSRNLHHLEKKIWKLGRFVHYDLLAHVLVNEVFPNLKKYKEIASWPNLDSLDYVEPINKYLTPNSVGIIARNRITYGRNLPYSFYLDLISLLKSKGYEVVWLGEEASTYNCPQGLAVDYRSSPEAKDLRNTLALVKNLKFTIQFYTASSRLAGLVGTPFIIFESPDQLWGFGQEGIRLELCSKGNRKIIASDFKLMYDNPEKAISLVQLAVEELEAGNYNDNIELVADKGEVEIMRTAWQEKYKC